MDTSRGWRWNDRKVNRSKWGGLQPEVTGCSIQSPHSTASNVELLQILVSKARTREGGQEGRMRDVDAEANAV
ncbi:MAG: hypothetical protein ACYTE5_12585 [Planctomycetota bacterium]